MNFGGQLNARASFSTGAHSVASLFPAILAIRYALEEPNMIVEEQISARQQRARKAIQDIIAEPAGRGYGDYVVKSASGRKYRVAMRGPSLNNS